MSNDIKVSLNIDLKASGVAMTNVVVSDEDRLRVVITNAASNNVIVIKGKIQGQDDYDVIKTITGNAKETLNVNVYDLVEIECTTYSSLSNHVRVVASSFNHAGVATSIGAASGTTIIDPDLVTFISSDNSVQITTDGTNNTIDLVSLGGGAGATKYIKNIILNDWSGPINGEYTLAIAYSTHLISNPVVSCYETNGSTFDLVLTSVNVDSFFNVVVKTSQIPDTRFLGKIIIE